MKGGERGQYNDEELDVENEHKEQRGDSAKFSRAKKIGAPLNAYTILLATLLAIYCKTGATTILQSAKASAQQTLQPLSTLVASPNT